MQLKCCFFCFVLIAVCLSLYVCLSEIFAPEKPRAEQILAHWLSNQSRLTVMSYSDGIKLNHSCEKVLRSAGSIFIVNALEVPYECVAECDFDFMHGLDRRLLTGVMAGLGAHASHVPQHYQSRVVACQSVMAGSVAHASYVPQHYQGKSELCPKSSCSEGAAQWVAKAECSDPVFYHS